MSQPSSPVLKARRQSHRLYSKMLSSILVFCFSICLVRFLFFSDQAPQLEVDTLVHRPQPPPANGHGIAHPWALHVAQPTALNNTLPTPPLLPADDVHLSGNLSLTAILPVTVQSVTNLPFHLRSLLGTSTSLSNVVLLSPHSLQAKIRHDLRTILSEEDEHEVVVSIYQWPEGMSLGEALLHAARGVGSDWVLLADEEGLEHFNTETRDILLLNTQPLMAYPAGPRGVDFHLACLTPSSTSQRAAYLVPPLVLPASLLPPVKNVDLHEPWVALGNYVSRSGSTLSGGQVIGSSNGSLEWCARYVPNSRTITPPSIGQLTEGLSVPDPQDANTSTSGGLGSFLLVAHTPEASNLVPLVCELVRQSHHATFLVFEGAGRSVPVSELASYSEECRSAIHPIPASSFPEDMQHELLSHIPGELDVLISALSEDEPVSKLVSLLARNATPGPLSMVYIPTKDLPFCDWMSAIDLEGWKSTHKPPLTPISHTDGF